MDTKSTQNQTLETLAEDTFVYIAVKGSLHANDCSVFGLRQEEIKALNQKYPGSGANVVNGIFVKASVMQTINALALLGYKVISSAGETDVIWTLQRES